MTHDALAKADAAPGERHILFGIVAFALLFSSMQGSMVSVALPDMISDLNAPLRWIGWVITISTVAQAISMPVVGKLSDELGRRRVFAGGIVLFTFSSMACTLAPNVYLLIAGRAVQGLAGGSLLPSAYGVLGDAFPDSRAQAVGFLSTIFPMGAIIGPNVGGIIVDHFGWRWTFAVNVPIGLLVLASTFVLMPSSQGRRSSSVDFLGVGFLAFAVTSLIYALTELGQTDVDPNPLLVMAAFTSAVAGLLLFLRHESRFPDPAVDLKLLKRREFAFVNTLNFFYGFSIFGAMGFLPLYATTAYGMSSSESGFMLTPRAIANIGASALTAMLLPRTGYRKPIIIGLIGTAVGYALLSQGIHEPHLGALQLSNFVYLSALVAIGGAAFGIAGPAMNNAAIELAPDKIAAITGLRGLFRLLGGAIGTAIVVLVASRAESMASGIEISFLGLAIVSMLTISLVHEVPDVVGGGLTAEHRPPRTGGQAIAPAERDRERL